LATELTPRRIVEELDRYIVGQKEAKKAVAIALRNRYRHRLLSPEMRDEVAPKNILMIGPTGVGKTEIARRLARLASAPFIKVEATRFTEVGYVGRDVESMIRDLVEVSLRMVRHEHMEEVREQAEQLAEERLVSLLAPMPTAEPPPNPFAAMFGMSAYSHTEPRESNATKDQESLQRTREELRNQLRQGLLEERVVEFEVEESGPNFFDVFAGVGMDEMGMSLQDMLTQVMPRKTRKRKMKIRDARKVLVQEEAQKLVDMDEAAAEAVRRTEESGIVFLDEMDKIAGRESSTGPDVSREGVQRDILPIVEGTTVNTKYGPVRTDHILFIAAGAFHVSKPADLIPELQGRFPIRVELHSLTQDDFCRILKEPQNALIKQYAALMATEGVHLEFTDDSLIEIARMAEEVNRRAENIGARRLHTILEKLLEDLSFAAPEIGEQTVTVTAEYVHRHLNDLVEDADLSRYIL
jgi:ATP-dependent HslUV protease ATP-binding subunit HslU